MRLDVEDLILQELQLVLQLLILLILLLLGAPRLLSLLGLDLTVRGLQHLAHVLAGLRPLLRRQVARLDLFGFRSIIQKST